MRTPCVFSPEALFWGRFGVALGSLWDHFGVTLGSLWGHFGLTVGHFEYMRVSLESLWVYEGPFSRNTHYPQDYIDLMQLWDRLALTLGALWGHFGATFGMRK